MCSTCDYTKFEEYEVNNRGIVNTRLKNAHVDLDINCDIEGKHFKIGNFTIYRCPTCGKKLF